MNFFGVIVGQLGGGLGIEGCQEGGDFGNGVKRKGVVHLIKFVGRRFFARRESDRYSQKVVSL